MCLGIPGKVLEIHQENDLAMGKVDFGGIAKEVCLAYTPEVKVGDYVIVHAGVAIDRLEPEDAQETLRLFEEMLGMEEGEPQMNTDERG